MRHGLILAAGPIADQVAAEAHSVTVADMIAVN